MINSQEEYEADLNAQGEAEAERLNEELNLKPCPFCGATPELCPCSGFRNLFTIVCNTGGCYLQYGANWRFPRERIIEMWNNRQENKK